MVNISKIGQPHVINMMKLFKNRLVSAQEIYAILDNTPNNARYLGCLPYDWFPRGMKSSDFTAFSEDVFETFSDFAKEVHSSPNVHIDCLVPFFKAFEKKLGAILGKKINISFENNGFYGKILKITTDKDKFALKFFHAGRRSDDHGKTKEIANAIAYNHSKTKAKRSQFFFGKIAGKNDKDGFILTEFVEGKRRFVPDTPPEFEYRRFDTPDAENGFNKINGKLYDFGLIKANYSNKTAETIAKKMLSAIKLGDKEEVLKLIAKYKGTNEYAEVIEKILNRYLMMREQSGKVFLKNYSGKQIEIMGLLERGGEQVEKEIVYPWEFM